MGKEKGPGHGQGQRVWWHGITMTSKARPALARCHSTRATAPAPAAGECTHRPAIAAHTAHTSEHTEHTEKLCKLSDAVRTSIP